MVRRDCDSPACAPVLLDAARPATRAVLVPPLLSR